MKKPLIALSALSALILSGCATTASNVKTPHQQHDHIRYIAQVAGSGQQSLLMIGDKYSYQVLDSSGSLSGLDAIARTLNPAHIRTKPIDIKLNDNQDRVYFNFDYNKGTPLTPSEQSALTPYCSQKHSTAYTGCQLSFYASVHQKQNPTAQMTALQGNYPVRITSYKASNDLMAKSTLSPLNLVAGVVTFPVWVMLMLTTGSSQNP